MRRRNSDASHLKNSGNSCSSNNSNNNEHERYAETGRRWSALAHANSNGLAAAAEECVSSISSPIRSAVQRTSSNPSASAHELPVSHFSPQPSLIRPSSVASSSPCHHRALSPSRPVLSSARLPPVSPAPSLQHEPPSLHHGSSPSRSLDNSTTANSFSTPSRSRDATPANLSSEELAALKQRFQELDNSGRGVLTKSEFYRLFTSIVELPCDVDGSEGSPLFAFAYDLFDSAGGEGLDMKEFISGCWILVGSEEERVRALFHMYDKDSSGSLNIQELQQVFRVMRSFAIAREGSEDAGCRSIGASGHRRCESELAMKELATKALKERDIDNDGQIGFEDFQHWCANNPTVKGWMDRLSKDTARGIARLREERERELLVKELSEIGLMDTNFWRKSLNVSMVTPVLRAKAFSPRPHRGDPNLSGDFALTAPVAGPSHSATPDNTDQEISDSMASSRSQLSGPLRDSDIGKFEINFEKLTFERRIGEGSFSEVYSGRWLDSAVAIKVFKSGPRLIMNADGTTSVVPHQLGGETLDDISFDPQMASNDESNSPSGDEESDQVDGRSRFLQEVALLMSLRHPHVLFYVGACVAPQYPLCIVSELIDGHSLYSLLHAKGSRRLTLAQKLSLTQDIARGMLYLHSRTPVVLHRDLKSANILVERLQNEQLKATIIDFGLSKLSSTEVSRSNANGLCGSLVTMAPEIMARECYRPGSDVYSFGIIAWEIFTSRVPFKNLNPAQVIMMVTSQKRRPPFRKSDAVPEDIKALIEKCWEHDIKKRPDFMLVVHELNRLKARVLAGA